MKILLIAFNGILKGVVDYNRKTKVIYLSMPVDLSIGRMNFDVMEPSAIEPNKKAKFEYKGKKESHFQYGDLPIYELTEIL